MTIRSSLLASALLFSALQRATASPYPSNSLGNLLVKRSDVTFEDCGDDSDPRRQKAGQAWYEAASLATAPIGGSLDDGTAFKDTNAYKHYFESADEGTTTKMYGGIQAGSSGDSGNGFSLKFIVTCQDSPDCADSLALTDALPISDSFTPKIRLCPKFFTDDRTANFLDSKGFKRDPGRRDNSWCQPGQPFVFFETASHTFLHEMTHLNQLGVEAGLFPDNNGDGATHGTEDIYQIADGYDQGSPEKSSRKLRDDWARYNDDNSRPMPMIQRIENAESYAAAATEFFFQQQCGWDEIME